jgi:hypothetical protein
MNMPRILISIDLEELHLQTGKGRALSLEERLQMSRKELENIITLLDRYQVRATFFVTAAWAQADPELLRQVSRKHEVAAYGCMEKKVLEQVIGRRIYGCRMPVGIRPDYGVLKAVGYLYHSGGQRLRPMTIEGGMYEIYAGRIRSLWRTKLFLGRQGVVSLRFSVHEFLGTAFPLRVGKVLEYLQRKGQFMPHIEWLQEQLSDE